MLILNDYVAKYAPDWDQYYTGGAATVQQFNTHRGNYVGISFDGDYHTWFYRTDLFEDPEEQAAFKEKYGWDLQWPETWEQLDQVSEFFNRPRRGSLWRHRPAQSRMGLDQLVSAIRIQCESRHETV